MAGPTLPCRGRGPAEVDRPAPDRRYAPGRGPALPGLDGMWFDASLTILGSYLIGSIPAAYLIARLVGSVDIRQTGEGNVGARNVFHVVGPAWGIVAFVADFAKGILVATLHLGQPGWRLAVAGASVLAGHAYPLWLRFVGGKGLSTVGGFGVVLMPVAAAIGAGAAAVAWGSTRVFMPTLVTVIVVAIVAGPLVGTPWHRLAIVTALFALTGVKRALDESRMREIEASTGWHRTRGLRG